MDNEMKVDIGNNILIFRYSKLMMGGVTKDELRLDIIKQLKEKVLVIDKMVDVIVVNKGDSKQ